MVTGGEVDRPVAGEPLGRLRGGRPALVQDRADHRAAHGPAHARPLDGRSRVQDGARAESGHHERGRLDVDQHGARGQEALDGQPIRRRDARADRIVEIILEPRQDEPELAIPAGGRPPVERHAPWRRALGARPRTRRRRRSARGCRREIALRPAFARPVHAPPSRARQPRGEPGRLRIARREDDSRRRERGFLPGQVLGIAGGAAHGGHEGHGAATRSPARARRWPGRAHRPGPGERRSPAPRRAGSPRWSDPRRRPRCARCAAGNRSSGAGAPP